MSVICSRCLSHMFWNARLFLFFIPEQLILFEAKMICPVKTEALGHTGFPLSVESQNNPVNHFDHKCVFCAFFKWNHQKKKNIPVLSEANVHNRIAKADHSYNHSCKESGHLITGVQVQQCAVGAQSCVQTDWCMVTLLANPNLGLRPSTILQVMTYNRCWSLSCKPTPTNP